MLMNFHFKNNHRAVLKWAIRIQWIWNKQMSWKKKSKTKRSDNNANNVHGFKLIQPLKLYGTVFFGWCWCSSLLLKSIKLSVSYGTQIFYNQMVVRRAFLPFSSFFCGEPIHRFSVWTIASVLCACVKPPKPKVHALSAKCSLPVIKKKRKKRKKNAHINSFMNWWL